jgi:quinol monooxygenase YgiN
MELGKSENSMMNNEICYRVEFTIEGSKIEEYKKLVQDMVRLVEANEPDTINYEFYLNKAETICVVNETYANSEAALAHRKGVAIQTILPKILNISKITRFDVYGEPNEELQKVLTSLSAQAYNLLAGFSR